MFELCLLAILLFIGWFWQDAIAKRENAIRIGRQLAQRCNLQLLDDTVSCNKIWLARDPRGHLQLVRLYEFEVSPDGVARLECNLQLFGNHLRSWHIPPYLQAMH